jgi:RNA polymerase sigma-70 factor (ECF subfamily)
MAEKNEDQRTDEELMRSYQDGDYVAFQALYSRHSSRVYGFLFSQIRNRVQTDDVFQATFLKLHQARHHYDPSFPFLPWLFTVTKSVMLDALRKAKTLREESNESAIENAVAEEMNVPSIDLAALDGNQKAVIELRYQHDLSFEEIAKRLETTPANVRQLISRGIKKLKAATSGGSK